MKYEFRTFEPSEESENKLLLLPDYWNGEMTDNYLLTGRKDLIIKIRGDEIKSKELVEEKNNIQLWKTTYLSIAPKFSELKIVKSRIMKYDGRCGADISRFTLSGQEYVTIGLESASIESLLETKKDLLLFGRNISYAEFFLEVVKNG